VDHPSPRPTAPERIRDVAIVGAGPGGSALAIHLARAGFDVALCDRAEFPRDKICGDFVSPKGLALIEALGCLRDVTATGAPPLTHATLVIDGRRVAGGDVPHVGDWLPYGLAVPRLRLDAVLAERAVAVGAELLEGLAVDGFEEESRTDAGGCVRLEGRQGRETRRVRARVIVGADGARSVVARQVGADEGIRRFGMAAMRAYAEGLPLDGTLQLFDEAFFPGYAWAFPTAPDAANVGVGVLTDGITGDGVSLRRWFERLVGYLTEHGRRRGARLEVGDPVGFPIRSYRPDQRYSFARGLLVGEAAGLVDPLNGEGIPLALESAALAAETLGDAFRRGAFDAGQLAAYDRACVACFDTDLRVSDLLISTVANRHLAGVWIRALEMFARLADADPAYAHTAGGVLAGVVPARELVSLEMMAKTALGAPLVLGAMLAGGAPRSLGGFVDQAMGFMRQAAAVTESLLNDGAGVADWARAVTGKERQLARLLLRRIPAR